MYSLYITQRGSMKLRFEAVILIGLLVGCKANVSPIGELAAQTATLTPSPEPTVTQTPTATLTATATLTPTATMSPTPFGCLRPPDDYTQVPLYNAVVLNRRTISMLEHAQELYGGTHVFLGALTQGSYNLGVTASFGTHDGGGAVDIAVRDVNDWNHVLYEEMDQIISALRRAGFAAWLRDVGDLYSNSPVHIHAIAIGDRELSEAAAGQLMSEYGYFAGFNGLPEDPQPDRHGGPVICEWMLEMGYADLR